jgi:hypothetical protein
MNHTMLAIFENGTSFHLERQTKSSRQNLFQVCWGIELEYK